MAEKQQRRMQGTALGGRTGMPPSKPYVYNGLGYDTMTESPGERVVRLSRKQQWSYVKLPPPTPDGTSAAQDLRCERCGYMRDAPGHLNSECA